MFKSSTFCPKQYIFAVLAVNGEKELTPPFELFCFALGQVHFIQCLSSVLLLQSSIILLKAVHLATLYMADTFSSKFMEDFPLRSLSSAATCNDNDNDIDLLSNSKPELGKGGRDWGISPRGV